MKITATQLRRIIKEELTLVLKEDDSDFDKDDVLGVFNGLAKSDKNKMNEAMSRITPDEVEAWKSGDWGYNADDKVDHPENPERFLHGEDPHDDEGSMVKSRLFSMKQMAGDVCDVLSPNDQLPGWVQDHISVAHENLQQVHGYLMGQQHSMDHGMVESKKALSESHNRITKEEMNAWMRGDWGFNSEEDK